MIKRRDQHLFDPGPKRILSLDGGGVRGLITLGMLKQVEDTLKASSKQPESFRLSDYFDLIGGTSTGALIATLLALGEKVDDITDLYFRMCPKIFTGGRWLVGLWSKFDAEAFDQIVDDEFRRVLLNNGVTPHEPAMDTNLLRTGLALATKRIDTGAVWVLSNNPRHKFWDAKEEPWLKYWAAQPEIKFFPNRHYSLRKVALASASAPYYLEPIELAISNEEKGLFFDGGASPYNNPSSELFLMSTLKSYSKDEHIPVWSPHGFGWNTGADNLYMLSLGTGTWRERLNIQAFRRKSAIAKAIYALSGIITDAETASVVLLQALSDAKPGYYVNLNLGDMSELRIVDTPLLTFHRINPTLDKEWLVKNLGDKFDYSRRVISKLRQLDVSEKANLKRCHELGVEMGLKSISEEIFPKAFDI